MSKNKSGWVSEWVSEWVSDKVTYWAVRWQLKRPWPAKVDFQDDTVLNVRLSPLAEDFRSVGSQPQLKSPWLGTSLVYRGVSTINLFPSEYYYSVCSWDAGVGETAASGFLSFFPPFPTRWRWPPRCGAGGFGAPVHAVSGVILTFSKTNPSRTPHARSRSWP